MTHSDYTKEKNKKKFLSIIHNYSSQISDYAKKSN